MSRIRGGGVVISKSRLAKDVMAEPSPSGSSVRKVRLSGLPNRKAANLRYR